MGSKLYSGRSVDACPSPSCWRAELPTAQTPSPLLSHLHLWPDGQWGRAHSSSGDLCPDPVPGMHVGVCMCVCVCAHHPQYTCTHPLGAAHLPLGSLICGNPNPHTAVIHITKEHRFVTSQRTRGLFGLATSPGHLISDWNYKRLFLCLFLETHLWHKKRWVCVKKRKKMDPEKTGVCEPSLKGPVSTGPRVLALIVLSLLGKSRAVRLLLLFPKLRAHHTHPC